MPSLWGLGSLEDNSETKIHVSPSVKKLLWETWKGKKDRRGREIKPEYDLDKVLRRELPSDPAGTSEMEVTLQIYVRMTWGKRISIS